MRPFGPTTGEDSQTSSGHDEPPGWALTYARAALRCGQKAPEVEAALVSKGLPPGQATAAVDRFFDSRLAGERQSRTWSSRWKWGSRIASLVVATGFLLAASKAGLEGVLRCAASLLFPLACIWFPEALGSYVGPSYSAGFGYVNRPTPGFFVALGGWLLLAAFAAAVLLRSL
jgi:hypothetical protein